MKKIIKICKSNKGVSEVLGTVLLLGIAVAIFSSLYIIVLSEPFEKEETYPTIAAFVEGDHIVIEHRGGDEVDFGNEFQFELGGVIKNIAVGDSPDTKDGKWSIGERLIINLTDIHGGSDPYDLDNSDVDIFGSQEIENDETSIFSGTLDIHPKSDIGIKCTVSDETPDIGDEIVITITVTHYKGDMIIPAGLNIYFLLPDGLEYKDSSTNSGEYNHNTGNWILDELGIRGSAILTINAKVVAKGTLAEYTQLALLLDGSTSISPSDWQIMRNGLSLAITNGYIPHNGMVELTVIQFGGWSNSRAWAQLELLSFGGPVVLTSDNYMAVASAIGSLQQISEYPADGGTAMSCAFRLAADVMSNDPNGYLAGTPFTGMASTHSDWPRQVVNLVTDGKPNIKYLHNERYKGSHTGFGSNQFILGQENTEVALAYFESIMPINEAESDEIDVVAVGSATDIPWLRDYVVRPQPGYEAPPFDGPGWVRHVSSYTEFANSLDEQFEYIFSGMKLKADMTPSSPIDITVKVNKDINIQPEDL